MRKRLLRFARKDNAQYVINDVACAIVRGFSEAITRLHNGELVAAALR